MFEDDERAIADIVDRGGVAVDALVGALRVLQAREDSLLAEARRLSQAADIAGRSAERIQALLFGFTKRAGGKFETPVGRRLRVQANGGKLPVEVVHGTDPTTVPEQYRRVQVSIDLDAVRESLAAGEVLGWAALGERGSHLRIA